MRSCGNKPTTTIGAQGSHPFWAEQGTRKTRERAPCAVRSTYLLTPRPLPGKVRGAAAGATQGSKTENLASCLCFTAGKPFALTERVSKARKDQIKRSGRMGDYFTLTPASRQDGGLLAGGAHGSGFWRKGRSLTEVLLTGISFSLVSGDKQFA